MNNCQMGDRKKRSEPQDVDNADQRQITYLKVTNYPATSNNTDLSKIPKRKLSVFYRSFDVIAQIDQEKERQNAADFRRTFGSPSVRIERARDQDADRQTNLKQRRDRPSILSGSPPRDRFAIGGKSSDSQVSKADSLSPVTFKLPQVREGTIVAITEASNDNESHERKKCFAARRSLSEGDCERYHRAKRRCRCVKGEEESSEDEKREKFPAFPSFNDARLQIMGLSCSKDIDSVYRENLSENELERKYIAFSIGLGTDRITLRQRMILSLRQRDQSERNFMEEIQKMQEDVKNLCPLCTDQESIDKVENIRHRLDTITRSAHRVSCAAETLGAVYQEHRISRAIFIGDKYLQLLRSRCENLAADIADIK
ncbi:Lymphoid-restricted membrane protein [Melipona quadrifasciata]|uniref:Lymphoid-restricted membrane protein n=1 Tax=Melipona quadrifasciata TaxID=166423 RepID=A0A0N0BKQ2_9HYME|nr:Lymphoid-restricted membrane protein [Melipona quadrifasciata]